MAEIQLKVIFIRKSYRQNSNRANRHAEIAVVVVPVAVAAVEVQVVRIGIIVRHSRPIVTLSTEVVKTTTIATTCSRQENQVKDTHLY